MSDSRVSAPRRGLQQAWAFRWIGRAVRLGRVAVFSGVVSIALLCGWVGVVRGDAEKRAMTLGRELATMMDLVGGAHRVKINGETIYVASAVTEESVKSVLDRFEGHCLKQTGGLKEQFDGLPKDAQEKLRKDMPDAWALRMGVLRDDAADGSEGTVMCIAHKEGGGLEGLMKKFSAFEATGELGAIGEFRHAYVRKTDSGGAHVLTSFTLGDFNVRKVFAEDEATESPMGVDPPDAPRPPSSFRLLSATVDDEPYGVQVFKTTESIENVVAFYDREMPKRGWLRMAGHLEIGGQIWQRHGVSMVISMNPGKLGERATVTFAEGRTTAPPGDPTPR